MHHARVERPVEEVASAALREAGDELLHAAVVLSFVLAGDGVARIAYAVEGVPPNEVRDALKNAESYLRHALAEQLDLKRVPRLAFRFVGVARKEVEPCGG